MANLPTRNNNPGDLRNTSTGQFNKYSSPTEGYNALVNDLNIKMSGKSKTGVTPDSDLLHFSSIYAPASDKNDPTSYANNLASQLGVPVTTKIKDLQPRIHDFARAISKNEGYQGSNSMVAGTSESTSQVQPILDNTQTVQTIDSYTDSIGKKLTKQQLTENINYMDSQGFSQDDIQKYVNGFKKDTTTQNTNIDPLNSPEVKKHVDEMVDLGRPHEAIQEYLSSVKSGDNVQPEIPTTDNSSYLNDTKEEFLSGGKHVVDSIIGGKEKLLQAKEDLNKPGLLNKATGVVEGVEGLVQPFLGTVAGGLQTVFSPITPMINNIVSSIAKSNPDIADSVSQAVKPLDDLAQKYPQESSVISDAITSLFAAFGEKAGGNKIKTSGEGTKIFDTTNKEVSKIQEKIMPKATVNETKLAMKEGRLVPSKEPGMFTSGTEGKILPSKKVIQSSKTIQKLIPGASKMDDAKLFDALDNKIGDIAQKIKPEMQKVQIKKDTLDSLTSTWEDIKKTQINEADATEELNITKRQKAFDSRIQKIKQANTLDEIWDERIDYDNSIPQNVKKAGSLSDQRLQDKKAEWLQNRQLLNDIIHDSGSGLGDSSKQAFSNMSDMYTAQSGLLSDVKSNLKAKPSKIMQWIKKNPVKAAAIGLTGVGLSGKTGKVISAVTGL